MISDVMIFFVGVLMFVCGPFLAVYSYSEGTLDGGEAFVAGMLLFAIGVGLIAGFAG